MKPRDTLPKMAHRRLRPPKLSFCPACDRPLRIDLASNEPTVCASCGIALLPALVAGFWRRAAAGVVDAALLLFTAGPLAYLAARATSQPALWSGKSALENLLRTLELTATQGIAYGAPMLLMAGLYLGMFWRLAGRTPGETLLRIRVVDSAGRRPNAIRTALRAAATLAGGLFGALGWAWIAVDLEKRAWHDWAAGTYVVRDS